MDEDKRELDGVEDDDPNTPDPAGLEPDDDTDPEDGDETLESGMAAARKVPEEGNEAKKPDTEPAEEPEKPAEEPPETKKATFSPEQQAELDRILQDRLARQHQSLTRKFEDQVLATTGKTLDQIKAETRQREVERLQTEQGLDEETAQKLVQQEAEIRELRAKEQALDAERESLRRAKEYEAERTAFLSNPKVNQVTKSLAQKYSAEIDQFSQNGSQVNYEVARDFILGTKLVDILGEMEKTAEQRVLANVQKRGKAAPETPGGAPPSGPTLTPQQVEVARKLGLKPSEYLDALKTRKRA